ncbi:hypothetical protein AXW67_36270 [Bradyrhizobium neotropicale]|uniref:Type I-E CRISPR-associated protein Cse1/CasA n=1 Tax=Bradyrhizobium neotropicale TaxID=1497615 RepID=A0A176ZIF9_9BRAD|nr:hypothetical protein AXW67_36270 [Bradyrhizobium neotropicale]
MPLPAVLLIFRFMSLNCIEEPIFTTTICTGQATLSLPALYSALMRDDVEDMPAVRPHQRQALHAFLVQVGALALLEGTTTDPSLDASVWTHLLRALTYKFTHDEPWSLIVEDLSKPGFLQPPIPEGTVAPLREREQTPDSLDILVTSKNHDVKAQRMAIATPEHWFYALLTLQTTQGYLGAGNYGISRMNGGYASRPFVGLAPSNRLGARVRRDINRLLQARREVLDENSGFAAVNGIGLVWLEPWDGVSAIAPKQLDPFYVEVCRRVRLIRENARIVALRGRSQAARIAFPKNTNGVTGDPWTPVDQRETIAKVLTVDGGGFHYKRVADLLDPQQYKAALLQQWRQADGTLDHSLVLTATAREQGGTDGFHERRIVVPTSALPFLGTRAHALASLVKERIQDAATIRARVLLTALYVLFQRAPDELKFPHAACETKAAPFLAAFDGGVDRNFFDALFDELAAPDGTAKRTARRQWIYTLKELAVLQLEAAKGATPRSGIRRYQAEGAAEDAIEFGFRKHFSMEMTHD